MPWNNNMKHITICKWKIECKGETMDIEDLANEQIEENNPEWIDLVGEVQSDPVNHPRHYQWFDTEVINVMKKVLTTEEYLGFLKGNSLKYRMRAGRKNTVFEDIRKAMFYEDLYQKFVRENTP